MSTNKVILVGAASLAAMFGIFHATKPKSKDEDTTNTEGEPKTTSESNPALVKTMDEMITEVKLKALLDQPGLNNRLTAAYKKMSPSEIADLHKFNFEYIGQGNPESIRNDKVYMARLQKTFIKYDIFTQFPFPKDLQTQAAKVKKPEVKSHLTKKTEVKNYILLHSKALPAEKNTFLAAIEKMTKDEISTIHNYIFNYFKKGIKPTDKVLMAKVNLIGTRYKLGN